MGNDYIRHAFPLVYALPVARYQGRGGPIEPNLYVGVIEITEQKASKMVQRKYP